jgi:hypothetical protein
MDKKEAQKNNKGGASKDWAEMSDGEEEVEEQQE